MTFGYNQTATLWRNLGSNGKGGYRFSLNGEHLVCRWEDRNEQYIDTRGDVAISKSVVWVNTDVRPGDKIVLGKSYETDPSASNALLVKGFVKTPGFKAGDFERRVLV